MDESVDSQKGDNEKKVISIEDKLKKLQNAGLMSDVRDVMGTGENTTSENDDVTLDEVPGDEPSEVIIESTTPEPVAATNEALTVASEETESKEEIDDDVVTDTDIDSLSESLEEDEDLLSMSDSVDDQDDDESADDEVTDVSADSLSELILPEGSDVEIEELKFKHDSSHLNVIKKTDIPQEIESIWEKTITRIPITT